MSWTIKFLVFLMFCCLSQGSIAQDIDAFLKTKVSRSEVYIDEAVVLSCQLYTKVPLLAVKESDYPVLDGFEVAAKPFYDHGGIPVFKKEKYKGVEYYVADLRKVVIYPNRIGQLVIPPVEGDFTFNVAKLDKSRNEKYLGEIPMVGADKRLKSEPVSVKVIELPKKKPEDFSGAIGTFKMKSEIKGSESKVGEIFALKISIEGYGDLGISTAPDLDLPEEVEIYDAVSDDDDVIFSDSGLLSERSFLYLLVATQAGTYKIPPAKFVYLDIETGEYETLVSSEHTVLMTKPKIKGTVVACR